jgi:voltage-gated potassium channel
MNKSLQKAEMAVYKLLKENGRQSELNDIVEYAICAIICLNAALIVLESMGYGGAMGKLLGIARVCFFVFFLVEYVVRIWIADIVMRDKAHPVKSRLRYMVSPRAIIDLMALLPVLLGSTIIDFRIFRVLRLFRIAQLHGLRKYTDILIKVVRLKGAQLLAAVFLLAVFMLTCAVIIHDFEAQAQPEVFNNILSSMWWAMATITTVGYGDMYPVTTMGKVMGSVISVLGVFIMAVPVAILTSGFIEVSSQTKQATRDI